MRLLLLSGVTAVPGVKNSEHSPPLFSFLVFQPRSDLKLLVGLLFAAPACIRESEIIVSLAQGVMTCDCALEKIDSFRVRLQLKSQTTQGPRVWDRRSSA